MNQEKYICECGKQFDTSIQLSHPKTKCKIYQENKRIKKQQEKEAKQLPNGMFSCEECGKEHDGSYGSGRFCSVHCRMSFIAKKVKNRKNTSKKKRAPYGTWTCKKCNLIFDTRKQLEEHNHSFHPFPKGSSWNKGLTKETDERVAKYVKTCSDRGHYVCPTKGQHLSEEHRRKTSISMKKFFKEHPDKVPYVLNHSSKESYPEQFFRQAFEK